MGVCGINHNYENTLTLKGDSLLLRKETGNFVVYKS